MSGRSAYRPHFVQNDAVSALRELPRGLRAGETTADHLHNALIHSRAGVGSHTAKASMASGSAGCSAGSHSFAQLMQRRYSPRVLFDFISAPTYPHSGQTSGTGLSHTTKSHAG